MKMCVGSLFFSVVDVQESHENSMHEELENELLTAIIFSNSDTDDDTVNLEVSDIQENSFDISLEQPTFEE